MVLFGYEDLTDAVAAIEALGADQELDERRKALLNDPVMVVTRESGLRSIHVLSEEMAFVAPAEHDLDLVASDDATTCSIVVLIGYGIVGVAHLDSPQQMSFFLKKWETLTSAAPTTLTSAAPTSVAIAGGYDDERGIAHPISVDILQALLSSEAAYQVQEFVTSKWNTTQTEEGFSCRVQEGSDIFLRKRNFAVWSSRLMPAYRWCH
ncbi:hypothetical protein PR003_g6847 [Phytophthora rubi]|uniref:Uncharacterized protein n=1 Tax=Phytophthora rubi TaxID=129364 RepID=A0A6A3MZZ6_9STRA|nr:hypothetical protein PR002_g6590 [Phytophthora rubi]KAE9041535.1 hypothetical protein PR001_g6567 [Phytophthora rubi]KAE9347586.1 hypothetical protein PR003_g6847 [Phytophthora rubi]